MLRRRQAKASVAAVAATAATLRRERLPPSAAALSPPASTNLGLKGFTHLGQNSGQNVRGGQVCSPIGRSVSPSFSAPPLSLPKLSFPVNWGWERILLFYFTTYTAHHAGVATSLVRFKFHHKGTNFLLRIGGCYTDCEDIQKSRALH